MRNTRHHLQIILLLCAALLAIHQVMAGDAPANTVILIALDGFRWDYSDRVDTPSLDFLIANGVRAESLIPSFPTKTFPNFYTIVTGLYPDHHGMVANNMYDAKLDKHFSTANREAVQNSQWWGGEPIWVTAEKAGVITASFFWVGSEARIAGIQPTYWYPYDGAVPNQYRIEQILKWLDLPVGKRPRLILAYFSLLDDVGHRYPPESPAVAAAIGTADSLTGMLLTGLQQRSILKQTHIILVSDHGMAATSRDRIIFLDDYINLSEVQVVDWSPVAALNVDKNGRQIYDSLRQGHAHMKVYLKSELPDRLHYGRHSRVPQIIAIADEGWSISSRDYYQRHPDGFDAGTHGYDNALASMGALFIAYGPKFQKGLRVSAFSNIHIYELLAHLLALTAAPNDGNLDSVRVMLKE